VRCVELRGEQISVSVHATAFPAFKFVLTHALAAPLQCVAVDINRYIGNALQCSGSMNEDMDKMSRDIHDNFDKYTVTYLKYKHYNIEPSVFVSNCMFVIIIFTFPILS